MCYLYYLYHYWTDEVVEARPRTKIITKPNPIIHLHFHGHKHNIYLLNSADVRVITTITIPVDSAYRYCIIVLELYDTAC